MSTVQSEYLELLAQADLLQLVGCLLDRPDRSLLDKWDIDPADRLELIRASGLPDTDGLAEVFNGAADVIAHTDVTRWADEHCRLFEAAVVCPINESGYDRRDKGAILSDICGFYRAFGFTLDDAVGEKADHMIGELQFFSLLLVMIADATQQGQEEKAQIARDAAAAFAKDHLGAWIFAFCDRMGQSTSLDLYQHAAILLALVYKATCDRHGIPLHDPLAILEPEPDVGTPYECGMAEGCAAGGDCGPAAEGLQ